MTEWRWIGEALILAVHDEQLAEHGGRPGVRDMSLLQSALARPRNRAAYGDPDAFDLAAAYAFGIIRDHPFVDGNKRVAFVAAAVFLIDHGYDIEASDEGKLLVTLGLAEGRVGEDDFAAWLRANCVDAIDPE
jgi:death on curing protein